MSTYKNLIGKDVNFLTTDPDNVQAEGQIWYNSPAGAFKNVAGASTWSSTGSLNTARRESGAAGTQTASVVFGGGLAPNGNPDTNATEEYNGFNFANSGNMNQAREGMGAAGTQTAALAFGGANYTSGGVLASNEEYGGSSWTAGNAMNNSRSYVAGFGLQTAAIAVGGGGPGTAVTESYDGTNWTNLSSPSNVPGILFTNASCGTQTAGIIFGGGYLDGFGKPPGPQAVTLEWDGSSWTAGGNLNQARRRLGGAGTQTAALGFGGYSGPPQFFNVTEFYDGSSWTTSSGTLATATGHMHGSGTADSALSAGGATSTAGAVATSYEFNNTINAVIQSSWSNGGNLNLARRFLGGTGTATAGLVFGGFQTNPALNFNESEEYDGSTWSEGNNLNNARRGIEGFGTQTAGVGVGGFPPPGVRTEEYNGSSWSNETDFATQRMNMFGSAGTQTAGLIFGGSGSVNTESYDGSSWSEVNNLPTGLSNARGNGTQTAALSMGGDTPAPAITDATSEWDGSNWTSGGNMLFGGSKMGAFGTQTEGYSVGGVFDTRVPTDYNLVQEYNGTAWAVDANLTTGRNAMGPANSAGSTGMIAGGDTGPTPTNATEEYTAGTSTLNIKTITTS